MGGQVCHGRPGIAGDAVKIAVTGATGFVGRHTIQALLDQGVIPTLLVREGSRIPLAWGECPRVDVDLHETPPNLFELAGQPDILIHLAWGGLPNYRSLTHFEQELPAQYRFLKTMIVSGLPHLFVAGTCFEYGMQSGPLHEGLEVTPTNPYGYAKNSLRQQLEYLKSLHAYSLIWGRLFYLWGDGQSPASLLPKLRGAISAGETRFAMSGGEQLRDYLAVTDAAAIIARLAKTRMDAGIVNICSGYPISVRRLVESWIEENGWNITPDLGKFPYPDYEPMAFWGDRRKLDQVLNTSTS